MKRKNKSWNYWWDKRNWKRGKIIYRREVAYKGCNKTCDFKELKTIRVFSKEIRNGIIDMYMANAEKNDLAKYI